MASKLDNMDIRQIYLLKQQGYSNRKISRTLPLNRNTINHYVTMFECSGLSWKEVLALSDTELRELFPEQSKTDIDRFEVLSTYFEDIKKRSTAVGFTYLAYWKSYRLKHPEGYGYTQFMEHYNKWKERLDVSMKLDHKAGEKLYIDFTGDKLSVVDKSTGEIQEVEVFVAVLPCSQYTFVKACRSQQKEELIACINDALNYYGGVPQAIVSDNLKSAVNKAHKYEPVINRSFKDCALHYGCVVDPARPYSPQDKALVERAVSLTYQRIFYPLTGMLFFSLEDLNKEISRLLMVYNDVKFQRMNCSRRELFLSTEKHTLRPLPSGRYEIREFRSAKVQRMGHIYLSADKHYYSVPYRYTSEQVEVQYNHSHVEIFHNRERIAVHERKNHPGYTSNPDHLSSTHKKYKDWSPDFFLRRAKDSGQHVYQYVETLFSRDAYPEHIYKRARGILDLGRQYGNERLNEACRRATHLGKYSYSIIKNILDKGLDKDIDIFHPDYQNKIHISSHENIRGAGNYQ
ncbi:MAG: IS21 family transposase [Flavobacteriales bacterium]